VGKDGGKNLVIGECSTRKSFGYPKSTHAEMDALRKIYVACNVRTRKRPIAGDFWVIRISHTGVLGASRPCSNCLSHMASAKFLKICSVNYSTEDQTIETEKFHLMKESSKTYVSTGFRKD